MKTILPLVLLAFAAAPAGAEVLSLSAPGTAGGFFDVFVNLTNVFDAPHDSDFFLGYGFDVSFDASVLSYAGETAGPLFDDISGNAGITAQVAGVATNVLLGPGDFTEPLNLAVLHFGVTGVGPTTIRISGDTANLDQGLIYLSGSDAISASVSVNALPEPNMGWLVGLGVALLAWQAWRPTLQNR